MKIGYKVDDRPTLHFRATLSISGILFVYPDDGSNNFEIALKPEEVEQFNSFKDVKIGAITIWIAVR